MAAAMTALAAFAAFPASAADFGFLGDRGLDDGIVFLGDRGFDDGRFFDRGLVDGAAPASQEFSERRITSGAANPTTSISNTGDNVNLCAPVQQVVNTGNVANEQGVVLSGSEVDDVDFTGSEINVTPDLSSTCDQTLNQAAAA
jgi:hypothetical protein